MPPQRKIIQDMVPPRHPERKTFPQKKEDVSLYQKRERILEEEALHESHHEAHKAPHQEIESEFHKKGSDVEHIKVRKIPNTFRHFEPVKKPRNRKPWIIGLLSLIGIVLIIYAISIVYGKAVVIITPVTQSLVAQGTFTASKDSIAGLPGGDIPYEVIQTPTMELDQTVPATSAGSSTSKAQGNIILYNSYSASSQELLVGTHLTNTQGLIYFTTKTVTIPGYKKSASGTITAGSVELGIIASNGGDNYNITPTDLTGDFRVAAYKGTARYSTIYGRIDPSNSITGGFSGVAENVSSTTLATTYANLKTQIGAQLLAQANKLIPDGYIMYSSAYSIDYTPLIPTVATSSNGSIEPNTASVGMTGTFYGAIFKESDLGEAIADKQNINLDTLFPDNSFSINGLASASFIITNPQTFSVKTGTPLIFTLNGPITIVGTFPPDTLKQQLAGLSVANSKVVFAHYSTISSAHAIITPFWKHSFPSAPDKITITIQSQ